jgi:hypothetical protein
MPVALLLIVVACVLAAALSGHRADSAMLHGYGASWQPTALTSRQTGLAATSASSGTFRIAGSIRGLYPGDSAPLVLTVTNPNHFAIVVTSISTTVGRPRASCVASNLTVHRFSGQLEVPASRSAKVSVPVTLSHRAPNACQGALFPLTYSGLARRRSYHVPPRRHHRRSRGPNKTP